MITIEYLRVLLVDGSRSMVETLSCIMVAHGCPVATFDPGVKTVKVAKH